MLINSGIYKDFLDVEDALKSIKKGGKGEKLSY
jgi:hypothetical protein